MPAIKPPRIDRENVIRPEEAARVAAVLDLLAESPPEERLKAAAQIVDEAQAAFDKLRPKRDALGLSLSLYEHRRAVNTAMGLSRTAFHEMRCTALGLTEDERKSKWLQRQLDLGDEGKRVIEERARLREVKKVTGASGKIGEVAEQAVRAEERAKAARAYRDAAAVELSNPPYSWGRREIAEIIGKNASRVSHIKGAAAKAAAQEET